LRTGSNQVFSEPVDLAIIRIGIAVLETDIATFDEAIFREPFLERRKGSNPARVPYSSTPTV
jgi:hypothetical protein